VDVQARGERALAGRPAEAALDQLEAWLRRDAAPGLGERMGAEAGQPRLPVQRRERLSAAGDERPNGVARLAADG